MNYKPKRRTLLFVPAVRERFYARALAGEADSIVFDLEDSVAASAKSLGRRMLQGLFPSAYEGPKELAIRINAPGTPFYEEDVQLLAGLRPHAVVLPKAESEAQVVALEAELGRCDSAGARPTEIIAMIETIAGLYRVREIASCSARVTALLVGGEDLVAEMGIARGRLAENPLLAHALAEIALACHARQVQCLGPIHRGYGDEAQLHELEGEARYLRQLNYRGQAAIHPTQLPVLNRVYDITAAEIARARHYLDLFRQAEQDQGTAVVVQDGQMEDLPSLQGVLALLRYAEEHGFS